MFKFGYLIGVLYLKYWFI